MVTTPEVVKTAKSYFGCDSLEGLELEDQGGSGTAGSHWDERVAREDLMCGQIGGYKGLTVLSASFFEDSGWYKITNKFWLHEAKIGKDKGCTFITEKCIGGDGKISTAHNDYCPTLKASIPDWTGMGCGYCGTTSDSTDSSLASYFNYFGSNVVATSGLADNCPLA